MNVDEFICGVFSHVCSGKYKNIKCSCRYDNVLTFQHNTKSWELEITPNIDTSGRGMMSHFRVIISTPTQRVSETVVHLSVLSRTIRSFK